MLLVSVLSKHVDFDSEPHQLELQASRFFLPGDRRFFAQDPCGNRLEFLEK
jgi:hypothetical protein